MKDIMLIIAVLAIFVLGFYVMKCLDNFLNENYKNIHINAEKSEPSCVMLTDNLSEEEMIKEIRKFKEKHGTVEVYLCDKESVMDTSKQFTDE